MSLSHKSLAVVSGIALVFIVLLNMNAQRDAPLAYTPATGKVIEAQGRGLEQVPQEYFTYTETVSLNLSHNKLSGALPAEIRHLAALEELDLSHNDFTGVPAEVGQLAALRVLNLSHNQLTGLPHELGLLEQLELLDLRGNPEYSREDLEIIRSSLPSTTVILLE